MPLTQGVCNNNNHNPIQSPPIQQHAKGQHGVRKTTPCPTAMHLYQQEPLYNMSPADHTQNYYQWNPNPVAVAGQNYVSPPVNNAEYLGQPVVDYQNASQTPVMGQSHPAQPAYNQTEQPPTAVERTSARVNQLAAVCRLNTAVQSASATLHDGTASLFQLILNDSECLTFGADVFRIGYGVQNSKLFYVKLEGHKNVSDYLPSLVYQQLLDEANEKDCQTVNWYYDSHGYKSGWVGIPLPTYPT